MCSDSSNILIFDNTVHNMCKGIFDIRTFREAKLICNTSFIHPGGGAAKPPIPQNFLPT